MSKLSARRERTSVAVSVAEPRGLQRPAERPWPARAEHPLLQLQRDLGNQALQRALGPISPGAPTDSVGRRLTAAERQEAEHRLARSCEDVRLHDDAAAGRLALAFGARALTAGPHVYFAPGHSSADRALLMHELAHVAAQDPALGFASGVAPAGHVAEHAAREVAAGRGPALPRVPVGVYRDPMPRADFEQQMQRFGVKRVYTGTYADQVKRIDYFGKGQRPGAQLSADTWTSWDPGADSSVYDWIIAAFAAFAKRLGGVPAVQELGFYALDYDPDDSGTLQPKPNTLAEYGGGLMAVYKSAVTFATAPSRPAGRSVLGSAAPLPHPTAEQGVMGTVAHELGHGYVETALTPRTPGSAASAPDPAFMNGFRRAAGWTLGESPDLYDGGVPEVQQALAGLQTPPAQYRITIDNWNSPRWVEQPVSEYSLDHPSEDVAEAISVYVTNPDLLKTRSPRRFDFLETHKTTLSPYLRKDLATIPLSPAQLGPRPLGTPVPPWLQPMPPVPQPVEPPVRLLPGPILEIRF